MNFKKMRKLKDIVVGLKAGPYTREWMSDKWTKEKVQLRTKQNTYVTQKKARAAKKVAASAKVEKTETETKTEVKTEEKTEEKIEEKPEEKTEEKTEETEAGEEVKEEEEKVEDQVDDDAPEVDVNDVEDIFSIDGKNTPLFKDFTTDDFLLVQMRVEMHHMVKAFANDVTSKDPDRLGIMADPTYVQKYYQSYFQRPLMPGQYGQASVESLLEY